MGVILDLIYPRRCMFCGKVIEKGYICAECPETIIPITGKICRRCGAEEDKCVCSAVINRYDASASALYYTGAGKSLVHRCKNAQNMRSVKLAAGYLKSAYERYYSGEKIDFVTCIPRDFYTYLRKGENHSEVMGKIFAKSVELKYKNLLRKTKISRKQKRLSRLQRLENISDAYKVKCGVEIHGKNILIIDDVKTTGATLNECAKVLKNSHAGKVFCLTLAITHLEKEDKSD